MYSATRPASCRCSDGVFIRDKWNFFRRMIEIPEADLDGDREFDPEVQKSSGEGGLLNNCSPRG